MGLAAFVLIFGPWVGIMGWIWLREGGLDASRRAFRGETTG